MIVRWYLGLAFVKNVCIGRVHQLPAEPDDRGLKQAPWQAYGMVGEWDDTDLKTHPAREDAMRVVLKHYTDRENRPKKPCDAHSEYRKGCVMCEMVNR